MKRTMNLKFKFNNVTATVWLTTPELKTPEQYDVEVKWIS